MSALSKFFVVLVTIFSVALVTLMVPNVTNRQNYRKQIEDLKAAKVAAEATALIRQQEVDRAINNESTRITSLTEKIRTLEQKNIDLAARVSDAEAESRKANAQQTAAEDRASTLAAAIDRQAKILAFAQTQMTSEQKSVLKIRTQLIESIDKLEEQTSQIELLTRQVRYQKEALTDANKELVRFERAFARMDPVLRASLLQEGAVATTGDGGFVPENVIEGKVTAVEKVGEQRFIQINVGAANKVRKNMKFLVHRGDDFLGNLLITFVDDNAAAGTLDAKPEVKVAAGDQVFAGNRIKSN